MSWYDNGMPVINDREVLATAELIRRLYAMPEGANGGPLHVIVEDGNTGDEHVHDSDYFGLREGHAIETYLCKSRWANNIGWVYDDELRCSEGAADLCRLILASFRRMPEPWRAAAIAWADGTAARDIRILADNPEAACTASPEQVDALIAELRAAEDAPPGLKACTPVPCPSFDEGSPSGQPTGYDYRRYGMFVDPPPQVDAEELLADARRAPHIRIKHTHISRVVDALGWDPATTPLFVGVPAGVQTGQLADAIRLCQQAGLLPDTPNGVVYLPEELDTP